MNKLSWNDNKAMPPAEGTSTAAGTKESKAQGEQEKEKHT